MKLKYLLAASVAGLTVTALAPTTVAAQQITSSIQGTVTDANGAPLSGATVVVTDGRTGASRTIVTGTTGTFGAPNLVSGGPYTVEVTADGFEGQTVNDVMINVQGATELTFSLTQGGGAIVVTGSRVQLTQLAVGPGTGFGAAVLESAPSFNQDVRDIVRLDPRVTLDKDSSSGQDRISCLGGNDRSNAFTVDAISQGDLYGLNGNGFASRSSTPIPFSAIRETSVEFAPFDVEYGQFTGCAINVITKSGSNQFHGGAFYEFSNNDLRAKTLPNGDDAPPVGDQKNYGFDLSGPIIPDRLFFFGAYSHQEAAQAYDFGPTGAAYPNVAAGVTVADFNRFSQILRDVYGRDNLGLVTNLPYTNDRYFGRLDFQITDTQRLEATYQKLDEVTVKRGDITNSSSSPIIAGLDNFYNSGTKSDYYSARLYSDWSDNFSTELRYAHSKIQDRQDPVGGGEAQSDNPLPRFVVGTNNGTAYGQLVSGPDFFRTANDLRTTVDTASAIAKLNAGDHAFKMGLGFNRVNIFNLFVPNATGTLVFRNLDDFENGILSNGTSFSLSGSNIFNGSIVGAYGNYSATGDVNDAAAAFTRDIYSIFAQDDWQINDRLSAILGLRVDWYAGDAPKFNPVFAERYGRSNAIGFGALAPSVMPRVAFTYDAGDFGPLSGGQLRLGAGMFSGGDPLVWFGNAFQNNGITYAEGSLLSSTCAGLTRPVDVVTGGTFTGVPGCLAPAGSGAAALGLGDAQSIDPNIKAPSVLRVNLGYESDLDLTDGGLFSGWRMKLDYIYSRFMNPYGVSDLSQVVDTSRGLNGYTVDGRPIYRAIDPLAEGCDAVLQSANPTPVYTGVTSACFATSRDDELMLTNTDGYSSQTASFMLSRHSEGGIFTDGGAFDFLVGYAYTDGHDRRAMTSSTATSNYDITAAFDRQNPDEARAIYANKHSITARADLTETLFGDYKTRFGLTLAAHSGRPYSLTFAGGAVFNDSASGNDNALLYVPTGVDDPNIVGSAANVTALLDYLKTTNCEYTPGQTVKRNTCDNDWYVDMDLSLSQEIPGPGRFFGVEDKIKLYATVDNFLNMLDKDWNVLRQRQYAGLQDVIGLTGIDAQGRYVLGSFNGVESIEGDNLTSIDGSIWRIKVGLSYNF